LLVEWLNELIFRAETERQVFTDFRIERVSDQELSASIRGPEVELNQTPVKAATMHGVAILEESGGLRATVVLDV
jgi:SHS2 domain-containing protein